MTKLSLLHVIKSVFAALIGVQSEENRIKDFQHGSLSTYIIVGLIMTLLFILVIVQIVSWVTAS